MPVDGFRQFTANFVAFVAQIPELLHYGQGEIYGGQLVLKIDLDEALALGERVLDPLGASTAQSLSAGVVVTNGPLGQQVRNRFELKSDPVQEPVRLNAEPFCVSLNCFRQFFIGLAGNDQQSRAPQTLNLCLGL